MANRRLNHVRTPHAEPFMFGFQFTVDGASAVSAQSTGSLSYVTVTKPAGTGIYRCTFTDCFEACLYATADYLVAAGTANRDIQPVAETNFGTSTPAVVDFQVRQTSDGAAVDPTSATIKVFVLFRNSQVTP